MIPGRRTYLVTGARAPGTLEIIRRLGRAGHTVLAADCVRAPVGRFSRYVRRYFQVPAPRTDHAGFAAALRKIAQGEGVDTLLPTCEEIYTVARHRGILAEVCSVFCADLDVLIRVHHKERFARLTYELGGPVVAPESVLVETTAQRRALASESQRWVFKPVYSRFAARTLVCPSSDRVNALTLDPANPWLAQRFAPGRELSSYGIAVRGRLTAHSVYHSRHRAGQGAGVYFVSEENAAVRGFVERIVTHLGFTGQIGFDFIVCAATGNVFVLECNPRLTSGIHLFAPDFDLDGALRGMAGGVAPSQPKMLGTAMLTHALRTGNRRAWWRDFSTADDVIAARDDPLPMLGQLAFLAEMGGRAIGRRTGIIAAMTADIEWNGETHS